MTVTTSVRSDSFVSDGSLTARNIPFPFRTANEIVITVNGAPRTFNTHYEISGVYPDAMLVPLTGFAATGQAVAYERITVAAQDYQISGSEIKAKSLETTLDRMAMVGVDLAALQSDLRARAVVVPIGETGLIIPGAAARANTTFNFDGAGNPFLAPIVTLATVAAAVAAGIVTVNAAGMTQLGLVSAEGATQIGLVNAAGATQVGLVIAAGTTQIGLVNAAAAVITSLVTTDKYVPGYADINSVSSGAPVAVNGHEVVFGASVSQVLMLLPVPVALATGDAFTVVYQAVGATGAVSVGSVQQYGPSGFLHNETTNISVTAGTAIEQTYTVAAGATVLLFYASNGTSLTFRAWNKVAGKTVVHADDVTPNSTIPPVNYQQRRIDAAAQPNNLLSVSAITQQIGVGDQLITISGNKVTMPGAGAGSAFSAVMDVSGFANGDWLVVFGRTNVSPGGAAAGSGITISSYNLDESKQGTPTVVREYFDQYFAVYIKLDLASGAAPDHIMLQTGNSGTMFAVRSTLEVEVLGLYAAGSVKPTRPVTSYLPLQIQPAPEVPQYLKSTVGVVEVGPGGSDTNSGSKASPLATLAAALRSGAGIIRLQPGTETRETKPLAFQGREVTIEGYGDVTAARPRVTGARQLVQGDFTVTTADSHVFFKALAVDPKAAWFRKLSDRTFRSMGKLATTAGVNGATPPRIACISEAAVRATDGGYWFGAGSMGTGIYIRPYGDTWSGYAVEYSVVSTLLTTSNNAMLRMREMGLEFATQGLMSVGGRFEFDNAQYRWTGGDPSSNEGVGIAAGSIGSTKNVLLEGIGSDAFSSNGGVTLRHENLVSINNGGDGHTSHGFNNTIRFHGGRFYGNGQGGTNETGSGYYEFFGIDAHDNYQSDIQAEAAIGGSVTEHRIVARDCRGNMLFRNTGTQSNAFTVDLLRMHGSLALSNLTRPCSMRDCEIAGLNANNIDGLAIQNVKSRGRLLFNGTSGANIDLNGAMIDMNGIGGAYISAGAPTLTFSSFTNVRGSGGSGATNIASSQAAAIDPSIPFFVGTP